MPDGTPPTPFETSTYVPTARPSHRAPHWRMPDGSALYDHFGPGFTLLALSSASDATALEHAASERRVPLRVLTVPDAALRDLYACNLALIRPDHHVAWRSDAPPSDAGCLWDTVLGRI